MKKRFFFLYLLIINTLYSKNIFYYDFKNVEVLKITVRANYKIYINNKYSGLYTKEYKSILHIEKEKDNFIFNGSLFKLNKTLKNGVNIGYRVDKIEDTKFSMNNKGEFEEKNLSYFPLIQGLPYFPEEFDISKAYKNNGKAVINFTNEEYFILPVNAVTQYSGKQKLWGQTYDLFNITYSYKEIPEDISYKINNIKGYHNLKVYFDQEKGLPVYIQDNFTEEFFLQDKIIKRDGFYLFFYTTGEKIDKDKIVRDLSDDKIIVEKDKEYLKIEKRKEGVAIVLENLLFKPDTSYLIESEYPKIDKIYEILSKIKDKNFLIVGHTAKAGTEEEQISLSLERAKKISEELIKRGINPEQIMYIGKGAKEPIAPNDTEENMKKNRRVEIIIID